MEFNNIDVSVAKRQGNIGVAKAVYEYTKLGYTVLLPASDSDKYDLVVDNGKLLKVQVKTSRQKRDNNAYTINLKTSGGNTKKYNIRKRKNDDYDLLFVLVEDGRCWSIPTEELGDATNSIVVGHKKYMDWML